MKGHGTFLLLLLLWVHGHGTLGFFYFFFSFFFLPAFPPLLRALGPRQAGLQEDRAGMGFA